MHLGLRTNMPLPRRGNTNDEWCNSRNAQTGCGDCGAPSIAENINLLKSTGGVSGFFAVSKHMCVGETCPTFARLEMDVLRIPEVKYCQGSCTCSRTSDCPLGCPFDDRIVTTSCLPGENCCPTNTDCGCNQLKDFNRPISGSIVIDGGTDYNTSKSSSHIIKLVDNNYWRRDCIHLKAGEQHKQNKVVYSNSCSEEVGSDDRGKSQGIRAYSKNCNSYAMNLNPAGNRFSSEHKCCTPKISGPFVLEKHYRDALFEAQAEALRTTSKPRNETEPILDKIIDAPIVLSLFADVPDYTLLNDNIFYILQNRMHCDCTQDGCIDVEQAQASFVDSNPNTTTTTNTDGTVNVECIGEWCPKGTAGYDALACICTTDICNEITEGPGMVICDCGAGDSEICRNGLTCEEMGGNCCCKKII